jgi:hypothetical protein
VHLDLVVFVERPAPCALVLPHFDRFLTRGEAIVRLS